MPPSTTKSAGPSGDATSASALPAQTFVQRMSKLILSVQFLWFVGHLVTVIQALTYALFARYGAGGPWNYAKAYYGTLLSYGIIMYKAHGIPQISVAYLHRILADENSWYFALALNWAVSKPLLVTLLPYTVFSLFHSLNYFRSEVVPALLPPAQHPTITPRVQDAILRLVKSYQNPALRLVAFAEVWFLFPTITFGVLLGWTSFMAPLLYARFLSFRYMTSPLTKAAFSELRTRSDSLMAHPQVPPAVKKIYDAARQQMTKMGEAMQPQAQAQ
ncbi:hypothetical protein DFJ77DRAFT_453157 [Powellomyces hirtus]|nr:hypothetical protein DFJ77DRAFT_453157 [Powellomyces hirtus]